MSNFWKSLAARQESAFEESAAKIVELWPTMDADQRAHAMHASLRAAITALEELSRQHPQFIDDRTLNDDVRVLNEVITGARYKRRVFVNQEREPI